MSPRLTSKERMVLAINNQQPDAVPVAPDMSNMIPSRLTGKPFWCIYRDQDPPLWSAYVDAVRYFGIDGWFTYGRLDWCYSDRQVVETEAVVSRTDEQIVTRIVSQTPSGELWKEMTYYRANPPTTTRKPVKNLAEDLPKLRYLFPSISGYGDETLRAQRDALGDDGALGIGVGVPGFQSLFGWFDGGLEAVTYAYYDHRDLVKEFVAMQEATFIRQAEMILDARPDFMLLGASGLWTLNSATSFFDLSLPYIKKVTRMAKEAGVPTMLHACGRERKLVEILATETDLDCINPLERPPMGDCDLAEVKRQFGSRLSLMGNLHTTEHMLLGKPEDVANAAREAIDAAGAGGGFILSTGDQCGRDTPDENIFTLVRTAREYGRY